MRTSRNRQEGPEAQRISSKAAASTMSRRFITEYIFGGNTVAAIATTVDYLRRVWSRAITREVRFELFRCLTNIPAFGSHVIDSGTLLGTFLLSVISMVSMLEDRRD